MTGEHSSRDRTSYKATQTSAFEQAVKALGIDAKQRVIAQLQVFLRDWCAGVPDDELKAVWRYKPILGQQAKHYALKEFEPIANYRVLFTDLEHKQILCFLDAFRKTSAYRENLRHATERAKNYWKAQE